MLRLLFVVSICLPLLVHGVGMAVIFGSTTVPPPEQVFGFKPGADYKLADYKQMVDYYRRLDAASDRVKVFDIGPTCQGREMIMAIVSSEENMARLEEYRGISERLAQARVSESEAAELARMGKVIVWIDGGLHASEVAHAQHSPELAFRLATGESEEVRFVRENVIVLQVPVMNPDGLDLIVDWYKRNLGTSHETSPLPELYHQYTGHDNNRDWFMMTQPETRNVSFLLYRRWYPQIVLNHHQGAPFPARIFVPPFAPPLNPNIPPLVVRGMDLVGNAMATRFEMEGKQGVVSRTGFDAWWNGGMRTVPCFHNMIGILVETALYAYATPHDYGVETLPRTFKNGLPTLEPSLDYPNPWKGGAWRLSDAVDYTLTASFGVLDVAARYRDQWLFNIYRMGRSAIEEGESQSPSAYVIPGDQHDPSSAVRMVKALIMGGLEIEQAQDNFQVGGRIVGEGSYLIRTAQPFRRYLVDLMEPQRYPERQGAGQGAQPYDVTGWTLPMQMGVNLIRAGGELKVAARKVEEAVLPPVKLPVGFHRYFAVDRRWNTSFQLVNRLLKRGVPVLVCPGELRIGDAALPPGAFLVDRAHRALLGRTAADLRVPVHGVQGDVGEAYTVRRPRLALYRPAAANMDEGWIRWLIEEFEFAYDALRDEAIVRGGLRNRYDVIILPNENKKILLQGPRETAPPPGPRRGVGEEGVENLRAFVREGGVLIALGAACGVPLDHFGLPVRNALEKVSDSVFSCPGSLLRLQVDNGDPLAWGMEPEVASWFVRGLAFERAENTESHAVETTEVARYPEKDILLSGWIKGEEKLGGKVGALRARLGKGQTVLLGFPPHFRGQAHGTFKLLFNAVFLGHAQRSTNSSGGDGRY